LNIASAIYCAVPLIKRNSTPGDTALRANTF
jgi:hypothetical protein